jgi:hypothetical protein
MLYILSGLWELLTSRTRAAHLYWECSACLCGIYNLLYILPYLSGISNLILLVCEKLGKYYKYQFIVLWDNADPLSGFSPYRRYGRA